MTMQILHLAPCHFLGSSPGGILHVGFSLSDEEGFPGGSRSSSMPLMSDRCLGSGEGVLVSGPGRYTASVPRPVLWLIARFKWKIVPKAAAAFPAPNKKNIQKNIYFLYMYVRARARVCVCVCV